MRASGHSLPLMFGLFEKRLEGDDSLMELARLRFRQAGLGAEMHAGSSEHLEWNLRFKPFPDASVVVHLPRDFRLMAGPSQNRILELAARFASQVRGFVLHDDPDLAARPNEYIQAARKLDSLLASVPNSPYVFIEYAAGLEPEVFADFFASIRELRRLSACVDVGHVGIRQTQRAYAASHPGEDVCRLRFEPSKLAQVMDEIEAAVGTALPRVIELIEALSALRKPVHFHLHDGHPLSSFSPFGVSDHLSFLAEIPLAFEYRGRRSVPLMFGLAGLSRILKTVLAALGPERASLTLEIHPTRERLSLGDGAGLFAHWQDKTHAEQTNHWLAVLRQNRDLLQTVITPFMGGVASPRRPPNSRLGETALPD